MLTEHLFITEHVTSQGNFNDISSEHSQTGGRAESTHGYFYTDNSVDTQVKSLTQLVKCSQLIKKTLSKVLKSPLRCPTFAGVSFGGQRWTEQGEGGSSTCAFGCVCWEEC